MFATKPDFAKPVPAEITLVLQRIMGTEHVAFLNRVADPFGCDDPCPEHQGGPHVPHAQCGEVVCVLCAKVFP